MKLYLFPSVMIALMMFASALPGKALGYSLVADDLTRANAHVHSDSTSESAFADRRDVWLDFSPFPQYPSAVLIGGSGIGFYDDVSSTSFAVSSATPELLFLGNQSGASFTSAGTAGEDRKASSKLGAKSDPGTPVPEPATMLLFGAGTAGLAVVARRRMK